MKSEHDLSIMSHSSNIIYESVTSIGEFGTLGLVLNMTIIRRMVKYNYRLTK